MSEKAGVSLGYLSEVERGQKEASSELLSSIAGSLGVSTAQMLRLVADYRIRSANSDLRRRMPRAYAYRRIVCMRGTVRMGLRPGGRFRRVRGCGVDWYAGLRSGGAGLDWETCENGNSGNWWMRCSVMGMAGAWSRTAS